MKLHLDFEARSVLDLKKVGAWAYALHPSTEITMLGFGADASRVQVFSGLDCRFDWTKLHIPGIETSLIGAHNAIFEYACYNLILHRRHGWPARWDPKLWTCTMARAAMCGLPLDLDGLTRVLGCKTPKDLEGRAVMLKLCKPLTTEPLTFDEGPAKYARMGVYNKGDVIGEIEVDALLPELPPSERRVWELDLVMNRRGIQIDLDLARKGAAMSKAMMGPLNDRIRVLTRGEIDRATQNTALKAWVKRQGVKVPAKFDVKAGEMKESLDKVAVTEMLARPDLPPTVREVIKLKRQAGKSTSTAKYAKALEMVCPDGRIRGNLQYHGAHTGRWAGRLLQTQNFPRGFKKEDQLDAIEYVKTGDAELFDMVYGDKAMDTLSNTLRGMIVAPAGKVLVSADYNAIEARGNFWLAGARAVLDAYARGESPYLDMGAYISRRPITKEGDPLDYKIAKAAILGCGFGMGWEKFRDAIYLETAKEGKPLLIPDDLAKRAVNGFREKYPEVPRMWREHEGAAIRAVQNPGVRYPVCGGKVLWAMSNDRRFLVCRLPSGRYLWYWKPAVIESYRLFCKDPKCVHWEKMDESVCPTRRPQTVLTFWGSHPKTGEWCQLTAWGGTLTENVTQAVARDIMVNGMFEVERAGFEMELTTHDDLLAEYPLHGRDKFVEPLPNFMAAMCKTPSWAAGFPVAAEGWIGERYRK